MLEKRHMKLNYAYSASVHVCLYGIALLHPCYVTPASTLPLCATLVTYPFSLLPLPGKAPASDSAASAFWNMPRGLAVNLQKVAAHFWRMQPKAELLLRLASMELKV